MNAKVLAACADALLGASIDALMDLAASVREGRPRELENVPESMRIPVLSGEQIYIITIERAR